jgi:hypothetical protein
VRKALKIIGIVLIVVISVMTVLIATRPDTFRVERSAHIKAPADVVHGLINDFHQWTLWSPWERLDPNLKRIYSGAPAGVGAVYDWNSESVGVGRMTILESKPADSVVIKLEFIKPFEATNQAMFKLSPSDGGTRVTWTMDGRNNVMGKAFSLFVDMDSMVGKDFELGLANLNSAAQTQPKAK